MKNLILFFFIVLTLSGCAEKVWSNSDKSTQQFHADRAQCTALSHGLSTNQISPTYGGNTAFGGGFAQGFNATSAILASHLQNEIYSDCMKGLGWVLVDKNKTDRPARSESKQ